MSLFLTKIYLAFATLVACSAASVSVGHDAEHTSLLESRNRVKPDDEPDDEPVDTPDDEPKSHEKHKHHANLKHHGKHHGKHHEAPKHHKEKLAIVRKEADEKQASVSAHEHGHKAHGKYKSLKEHNEAIEAAHKAAHQNKLDAIHQKAEAATQAVEKKNQEEEEQKEAEEEKELQQVKTKRVGDPIKDMDKIDDDELLFTNDICYGTGVQELERYPGPVHRLLNECRQACMDDWNCFFYIYWPKDEDGKNVDGECQNNCRLYNKCSSKSSIDKEPGMSRATCQSYTFAMGETTLSKRPANSTAVQIHPIGAISSATALMASSLAWAQ